MAQSSPAQSAQQQQLRQEHHELICVGFGPSAISLGIALKESSPTTDVVFLEEQPKSLWQPLSDLPGHTHMGSNFLNDLITLQNPRSRFTFIQFLHSRKLLVDFTNLGLMQPSRDIFGDYLSWCASHFESEARYGSQITSIEPVFSNKRKVGRWNVTARNQETGQRTLYTAKRLIVSVEQRPELPSVLLKPSLGQAVVHASRCMNRVADLTRPEAPPVRIAIFGQTQEAAELFMDLYDIRSDREVFWFVEGQSLDAGITSPFAEASFSEPEASRVVPELREQKLNGSRIDPSTLRKVYETQYAQSVKQPDSTKWKFQIKLNCLIGDTRQSSDGQVQLTWFDKNKEQMQKLDFGLVIAATSFSRTDLHQSLFVNLQKRGLLDGSFPTINGDYAVNLRRTVPEPGVGLWCMGSVGTTEKSVGEGSFSIVAERSARIVRAVATCKKQEQRAEREQVAQGVQAQL